MSLQQELDFLWQEKNQDALDAIKKKTNRKSNKK